MKEISDFVNTIEVGPEGVKCVDEKISNLNGTLLLISKGAISKRIKSMAKEISKNINQNYVPLIIMDGGQNFGTDLYSALSSEGINLPPEIAYVKSYDGKKSTGNVKITCDFINLKGKNIILYEDIVDTGKTMLELKKYLLEKIEALSVTVCSLLYKPSKDKHNQKPDYTGFIIPGDAFVFGYGMDLNGESRKLKNIYVNN